MENPFAVKMFMILSLIKKKTERMFATENPIKSNKLFGRYFFRIHKNRSLAAEIVELDL